MTATMKAMLKSTKHSDTIYHVSDEFIVLKTKVISNGSDMFLGITDFTLESLSVKRQSVPTTPVIDVSRMVEIVLVSYGEPCKLIISKAPLIIL